MRVKNNKQSTDTWCGQQIEPAAYYTLEQVEIQKWQNDSKALSDIGSGNLLMNDHSNDIVDVAQAFAYFLTNKVDVISQPSPFASKKIGTKSLFSRTHGKTFAVVAGDNTLDFVVPYNICKINGLEIIGGELSDKADFKVAHPTYGTLGQFAFGNYIAKDFYSRVSNYDADLVLNLIIRIEYNSASAKNIYVNYLLHEVV